MSQASLGQPAMERLLGGRLKKKSSAGSKIKFLILYLPPHGSTPVLITTQLRLFPMLQPAIFCCFITLFPILSCLTIIPVRDGIIGLNATEAQKAESFNISVIDCGCRWFGTAPFCKGECPEGWTEKRAGTCRYPKASPVPVFEKAFGNPCLISKKVFCCHPNTEDSAWSGKWISAKSGSRRECSYKIEQEKLNVTEDKEYCGRLKCDEFDDKMTRITTANYEITGFSCNTVENVIENLTGTAVNGTISWKSSEGDLDSWFKYGHPIDWDKIIFDGDEIVFDDGNEKVFDTDQLIFGDDYIKTNGSEPLQA